MINTIQIHYDYNEEDGILPSGMPRGRAYCAASCPHLNTDDNTCELFMGSVVPVRIGKESRQAWEPVHACHIHEVNGR